MKPRFFRRIEGLNEPTKDQTRTLLQLRSSEEDELQHRSDQYGVFGISVPSADELAETREGYTVDVIAVHGLGGDPYFTWQHDNGYNWLSHLHEEFPGIRVFSYGYDSGIAFASDYTLLSDYARHLLENIKLVRSTEQEQNRKIVFVCHSLGGLLVKQAVLLANNERGLYQALYSTFGGLFFLGTPHSGTSFTSYSEVLSSVAKEVLFPSRVDDLLEHFKSQLLSSLNTNARTLLQHAELFQRHAYGVPIRCFVESRPLSNRKHVLVDEQSGSTGISGERCITIQESDHQQICRHRSLHCASFDPILHELKDLLRNHRTMKSQSTQDGHIVARKDQHISQALQEKHKSNALINAVSRNNVNAVRRLIENGADVNAFDAHLNTALHMGCMKGHFELASLLVESGAAVDLANEDGQQPLHIAVRSRSLKLVKLLLSYRADPNARDGRKCTSMHVAAEVGDDSILEVLLDHGADLMVKDRSGQLPVRTARKQNHLSAMRLLQKWAQSSQQTQLALINARGNGGKLTSAQSHARFMAYNFPSAMVVNFDMDSSLKNNASQIARAAERGDIDAVEDMLDAGIEPDPATLYLAAGESRSDVVAVLADLMPDIDADVGWSGNALCAAASSSGGYDVIKILLEKGANINWQGGKYGCALQAATSAYRLNNVQLLLQYGADVNMQCGHYGNALTAAARHRSHFEEMATLFLEHGADINAHGPGEYGNPLQTAVWMKHVDNVEFLLAQGASATLSGKFGSALDIARNGAFRFRSNDEDERKILMLVDEERMMGFVEDDDADDSYGVTGMRRLGLGE